MHHLRLYFSASARPVGAVGTAIIALSLANAQSAVAQERTVSEAVKQYQLERSSPTVENIDGRLPIDVRWAKVLLLSDGRILFFDALLPRIWVADGKGKLSSLGREGSGPGEFRSPSFAGEFNDEVWVYDVAQRRFSFFGLSTMRHKRTLAWSGVSKDGWSLSSPISINQKGMVAITGGGDRRIVAAGALRWTPVYQVHGSLVTPNRPFSRVHVLNSTHRIELPGVRSAVVRDQPFSDRSLIAASPDGSKLVVLSQAEEFAPAGDSLTVFKLDGTASVQWSSPLGVLRKPLEAAALRELVRREFSSFAEAAQDAGSAVPPLAAFDASLFKPKTRTPASRALVDNDGAVLIRENDWLVDSVVYTMFRSDGKRQGRIVVPSTHHIVAWRASKVAVVQVGPDGTERLYTAVLRAVR